VRYSTVCGEQCNVGDVSETFSWHSVVCWCSTHRSESQSPAQFKKIEKQVKDKRNKKSS
jgi:hypothetical protein